MNALKLEYYQDPGHGWVAVPLTLLEAWSFRPSRYSYRDGSVGYLEEDCDAAAFMRDAKARGVEVELVERYTDRDSPIRALRRFEG